MLAALNLHCRPDTVANAFTTLMSLFNDNMGADSEDILAFRSRFDGMINKMSRCKIFIPQILMVMFFLRSLHSRYSPLLDQFRNHLRSIETASLDSIVLHICFHDDFTVVGKEKKGSKGPKAAAAATSPAGPTSQDGRSWNNPWEWLAKLSPDSVKGRWKRSLRGSGFCPICHRGDERHSPVDCPLLVDLNLKLIKVAPPAAPSTPAPASTAPAPSPTPGGRSAVADGAPGLGTAGSNTAPSGLMATTAPASADEYDSDDTYRWDGDECGVVFSASTSATKSNSTVTRYDPSCNHVVVVPSCLTVAPTTTMPASSASSASSRGVSVSKRLTSIILRMSTSSILPPSGACRFAVADSGATDHMFPDKSAFISYKLVASLQVRLSRSIASAPIASNLAVASSVLKALAFWFTFLPSS